MDHIILSEKKRDRPKSDRKTCTFRLTPEVVAFMDNMPWGTVSAEVDKACRRAWGLPDLNAAGDAE
jgi:hypothetical protein